MPKILGPIPANKHEQQVLNQLKSQLPPDWIVVPNVGWSVRKQGEGATPTAYVRDGEADFVVLVPGLGWIVLEVKGSRFVKISEDGCWERSSNGSDWTAIWPKSPPEQATSNMHQIESVLVKNCSWHRKDSIPYAYAVVYPQGEILEGEFAMYDSTTVICKKSLGDLQKRIRVAIQSRGSEKKGDKLTPEMALKFAQTLVNFPLSISPVDTAEEAIDDSNVVEELTRQQFAAIQGIFRNPSVAVTGPAGSGKTVLAIWRLAALVEQGKRAVFLCYNKKLAEHLRLKNPDLAEYIFNVDKFFARLAPGAKSADSASMATFFDEDLPGSVIDKTSTLAANQKYEALIIDEGQDFGEYRLWAAKALIREEGSFLYFADDRQDLYGREARETVGVEIVFSLTHNCRNTIRINTTSNLVDDEHIPPMPGLPEGVPPLVSTPGSHKAMAKAAWDLVGKWSHELGKVAILSPYQLENSAMDKARTGYNKRLVEDLSEWEKSDTVFFSTIKSFKGLEADVVIVVDVDSPKDNTPLEKSDLYVACTRARSRLALLCVSKDAHSYLGGTSSD